MSRLPTFGSALSAIAVASMLAGCAGPMARQSAASSSDPSRIAAKSDVALALRAQAAVAAGDFVAAVDLAERAVEKSPQDPTVRSILANAYFGAGRFASAEAAYRDAISLDPNQPQLLLKLGLVQIANGKSAEAVAMLGSVNTMLEAADYGLALALAGNAAQAVDVLEAAARRGGADSRVRQNLALAYGFTGNWEAARTVAAQDLPANLVDSRLQQWMAMSKPGRASDQVAALVGVTPASIDPGQPTRLALNAVAPLPAQQAPVAVAAATVPAMPPQFAAMSPAPEPVYYSSDTIAQSVEEQPALAAFQPVPAAVVVAAPVIDDAIAAPASLPPVMAAIAPTIDRAPTIEARAVVAARGDASARFTPSVRPGHSSKSAPVVVQIGAYSNAGRVERAWDKAAGDHKSLGRYTPTSARFESASGTVYRLAVKGFASVSEAKSLCSSLQKQGRACFVRQVAGDSPVQFASR